MRHFMGFCPVGALPGGMFHSAFVALLITLLRLFPGMGARLFCATVGTVAITMIAGRTDKHFLAAQSAPITSSSSIHQQNKPMGLDETRRCMKYFYCNVALFGLRGATSILDVEIWGRCRACSFLRQVAFVPHSHWACQPIQTKKSDVHHRVS
jgi:hypothetical protein